MTKLDDTSLPPEATPRDQRLLMAGVAFVAVLGQLLSSALPDEISNSAVAWVIRSVLLVGCLVVLVLIVNPKWLRFFRKSGIRIEIPTGISHAQDKRKEKLERRNKSALIIYIVTGIPLTALYYFGTALYDQITTAIIYIILSIAISALIGAVMCRIGAVMYRILRRHSWRVFLRFVRRLIYHHMRHNKTAHMVRRWERDPYH